MSDWIHIIMAKQVTLTETDDDCTFCLFRQYVFDLWLFKLIFKQTITFLTSNVLVRYARPLLYASYFVNLNHSLPLINNEIVVTCNHFSWNSRASDRETIFGKVSTIHVLISRQLIFQHLNSCMQYNFNKLVNVSVCRKHETINSKPEVGERERERRSVALTLDGSHAIHFLKNQVSLSVHRCNY